MRLKKILVGSFKNMSDNWRSELEPGVKTLAVSNFISTFICRDYERAVLILPKAVL